MPMAFQIQDGVWPTMITPFSKENKVDFHGLEAMCEWYVHKGCAGVFAVCQSSEMFFLSPQEKLDIARCVVSAIGGRIQVIASGHTAPDRPTQLAEIEQMLKTGVEAYVLVSNRLDVDNQGDEVFTDNIEAVFQAFPDTSFGIYECPYPYKRLVSLEYLRVAAPSGRLVFLKDTCCEKPLLRARLDAVKGTPLRIFNANAASFLDSYQHGAAGYSGVMANFHPDLYRRLMELWGKDPRRAALLAGFLTLAGAIEARQYPAVAKYHMNLENIDCTHLTRSLDFCELYSNTLMEVENLFEMEAAVRRWLDS